MIARRPAFLAPLLAMCLTVSGCVLGFVEGAEYVEISDGADYDQWVVVTFDGLDDEFSQQAADALLDTELAADEALARAGVGMIDGNEVGDHGYQLFFVGTDRHRMWQVLRPVFAEAPMAWTRVELFTSLDGDPEVIRPR